MNENRNGNVYANSRYKIFNDLGLGDVRTYVDENGGIWFYMNDIARILDIRNPRDITARLRKSGFEETVKLMHTPVKSNNQYKKFTVNVSETIVNKSALLQICARSRKPNAKKLVTFVSKKIVPSLMEFIGHIIPEDRIMN